jgi:hypothetical protein
MIRDQDISQDKSLGELGRESFWFVAHTLFAFLIFVAVIFAITLNHPDPDSIVPKFAGTVLSFVIPMIGGFLISRFQQNTISRYVWISGLVIFSVVCVWVLDLPTGKGLCETCGAVEKLWRTFFTFSNGSGLMGGDGVLVGAWIPLSMIGYAVGASFGLER